MFPNAGGWLAAPANTMQLVRDPLPLLRGLGERHGRSFMLTLLDGPSLVSGDPAVVADMFAGGGTHADAPNEIVTPLVGERSIVLANGAPHRRKRKMLAPPFHGARMLAYGQTIADATRRGVDSLRPGDTLDVLDMTQRLSLEVILRAAFGVTDPVRVQVLQRAIYGVVSGFPAWLMFTPLLQRPMAGVGPWDRHLRAVAALKSLLLEEIAAARSVPEGSRDDVLSMMLTARDEQGQGMPDDEIVDELRTLIIAGHETTATTLGWALWQLHRNPDVLTRLHAELDTLPSDASPAALSKLPYLTATCDETLRMHPIVPVFRRRLTQAMRLGDHEMPAGTILSPAVMMTHYDPSLYPDPDQFRPERFLERKFGPTEFMPFGGGNRRCLGAAFANFELQVALGTLIANHRFSDIDTSPRRVVMHGVTTRANAPIRLRYEGRRA